MNWWQNETPIKFKFRLKNPHTSDVGRKSNSPIPPSTPLPQWIHMYFMDSKHLLSESDKCVFFLEADKRGRLLNTTHNVRHKGFFHPRSYIWICCLLELLDSYTAIKDDKERVLGSAVCDHPATMHAKVEHLFCQCWPVTFLESSSESSCSYHSCYTQPGVQFREMTGLLSHRFNCGLHGSIIGWIIIILSNITIHFNL